jgi:hypothetical protein
MVCGLKQKSPDLVHNVPPQPVAQEQELAHLRVVHVPAVRVPVEVVEHVRAVGVGAVAAG